jgi:ABC-type phosphate/phosphonate transport system substrate-binding protein
MVQRMSSGEFDVVFATAVVFARQTGGFYGDPILMSELPGDIKPARDGSPVLRFGVGIAGPSSPLFAAKEDDPAALKAALAGAPMAVPSSDSAAGFIYPLIKLKQDYGLAAPAQFYFCDSDAEVVKNVVAGLAPVGACRRGELDALLPKDAEGKYCRILFPTDLFPTDPVVLRKSLSPERSPLGIELKVALRDFLKTEAPKTTPGLAYENAAARSYEKIVSDLKLFDASRASAGLAPDPAATAAPAATPPPAPAIPPAATPAPSPALPPQALPPARPAMPGMIGGGR